MSDQTHCPCGGLCHHDENPCSLGCIAAEYRHFAAANTAHYATLEKLRDNLNEPYRGVLQAVIDLVDQPGPSNNLSWALEGLRQDAVKQWLASDEAEHELLRTLHRLHSFELWRWHEPTLDGGVVNQRGTSAEFASAILAHWVDAEEVMPDPA